MEADAPIRLPDHRAAAAPTWAALLAACPEIALALREALTRFDAALADLVAASPSATLPVAHAA